MQRALLLCLSLVCFFATTDGLAVVHEHDVQVDFSFDTEAIPYKQVNGYRLYKGSEMICETGPVEPQSITCAVVGEDGTYDFSLAALYTDGSESPQSDPVTFTIIDSNQPPAISLSGATTTLAEDTDTTAANRIATIIVDDDGQGTNALSLSGADAALFTITGSDLYLRAGVVLDFETKPSLAVTVEVNDPALPGAPEDSAGLVITVTDVNQAPSLSLSGVTTTLAEDTDTAAAIKVAHISVTDDGEGSNALSLSGADTGFFTITGSDLFLKAGVVLDFETKPSLAVTVEVNDPALPGAPEDSAGLVITVTDVNQAPSLSLSGVTTTLAEDTDTAAAIKVAHIGVTDDGEGSNALSLSGADTGLFTIAGSDLFLKAGVVLDFETKPSLAVTVEVNDPALPGAPEDSASLSISITDVEEQPPADEHAHDIQVDFSFETAGTAGKVTTGYRLYKEGIAVCDSELVDPQCLVCTVVGEDGTYAFTLSALYSDGSESPQSAPFNFTISDDQTPLPGTLTAVIATTSLEGEAPFSLTLDGTASTGPITSYAWSFGDGETAGGLTATHTYHNPGSYTATLTVADSGGATHQDAITITVNEPAPPDPGTAPVAVISSSTAVGEAPLTVQFDGSGSTATQAPMASYAWDFGDGYSAQGPTASHTFLTPGTYQTTLLVTDNVGLTNQASTPVIITAPPAAENQPPVSSFTATPISGTTPLIVDFDASGSSDPDGTITDYNWNFGDGATASGMSVQHAYTGAADYTVTLQVTDDQGETDESTLIVSVLPEDETVLPFELGEIEVGSDWNHYTFENSFVDPVVVAGPLGNGDTDPATIRIRNVDRNGFDIRVQEWDYLDGDHAPETFSFIVMEKGVVTLDNGARLEAGTFSATTGFQKISFQQSYDVAPVVLTQVITENETDAVTGRIRKLSRYSFDYKLQEQESTKTAHTTETVGYLAWEPGSGEIAGLQYETGFTSQGVTNQWRTISFQTAFPEPPLFIADMQSTNGGDTATVRSRNISGSTAEVAIEEEQSKDNELNHAAEDVGYLAIGATTATQ